MGDQDLKNLPRGLRMAAMGQRSRATRSRVSREEHEKRSETLRNLTNKVLTPRKTPQKPEKRTPQRQAQVVQSTPSKSKQTPTPAKQCTPAKDAHTETDTETPTVFTSNAITLPTMVAGSIGANLAQPSRAETDTDNATETDRPRY